MSRWAILVLVTVAYALGAFAALAVAPLSPFLLDAFRLTRAQVGFLLPALYVGAVAMSLSAGWLTDRLGVRPTLALGQLVTGAMVAVAALSGTVSALLACLVFAGFGFSVLNPASGKAVVTWFPPQERGLAMGVKQTGLTLGGIAAALVLPPIALAFGWRAALATAGAASLVSATLVALVYRDPAGARGVTASAAPRLSEALAFLRRPGVVVVFASGLVLSVGQASLLAFLVLYAKETFAVSAVEAARLLALAQLGGTASRLGWGFVSDRFLGGRRRPGVVVCALVTAAAYGVLAVGNLVPFGLVAPLMLVAGAGAFGWVGLYFALMAELGGARYAGLLTGIAVAFAWGGMLVGPPLFGLVLQAAGDYRLAWLGLAGAALAVALALPRPRPLVDRG